MKTKLVLSLISVLLIASTSSAKLAVIANRSLAMDKECQVAIRDFAEDIELMQGKTVYLDMTSFDEISGPTTWDAFHAAAELRSMLLALWNDRTDPLEGAIFVGDLPIAQYEYETYDSDYGCVVIRNLPCDLYFMDLNGTWLDNAKDGDWYLTRPGGGNVWQSQTNVYDAVSGDHKLEIWVSRIVPSAMPACGNEKDLLLDYLGRVRHRMAGGYQSTQWRTLNVVDDVNLCPGFNPGTTGIYGANNDVLLRSTGSDNGPNVIDHLSGPSANKAAGGYEYCFMFEHSCWHSIGNISDENVRAIANSGTPANTRFFMLDGCSACRWTVGGGSGHDCIGAQLAQTQNGLAAVGMTEASSIDFSGVAKYLSQDSSFGAAVKKAYDGFFNYDIASIVILGAGNLRLRPYPSSPCLFKQASINNGVTLAKRDFTYTNGTFIMYGSGGGVGAYSDHDECRYMYHTLNGDGDVYFYVTSLQNIGSKPQVGLMIREGLSAGAKSVSLMFGPGSSNNLKFMVRQNTGGTTASSAYSVTPPLWLKLSRKSNLCIAYIGYGASLPSSWTSLCGVGITMNQNALIGMAQASGSASTLCQASAKNVCFPVQQIIKSISSNLAPYQYQAVMGGNKDFILSPNNWTAASGIISNNQESRLRLVFGAQQISFMWSVSSESGYDFLRVYVDGRNNAEISGSTPWNSVSTTYVPLYLCNSRVSSYDVIYSKDASVSVGSDQGWIQSLNKLQ